MTSGTTPDIAPPISMPNPTTVAPTAILNFNGIFETFSSVGGNGDFPEIIIHSLVPSFFLLGAYYICCVQSNPQRHNCNFYQDFVKHNHSPTK